MNLIEILVQEIQQNHLEESVEILCIDDGSTNEVFRRENQLLMNQTNRNYFRYRELGQNVGRGRIRIELVKEAKADYILFLDCDVLPDKKDFIGRYLRQIEDKEADLVYGGISYSRQIIFGDEYTFYLYMSNRTEVKKPEERSIVPWRHIHSANIIVRKEAFEKVPLDDKFQGYGYEDSEWAIRMTQKYKVLHIDNPVSHLGLISKVHYYERMRQSIKNYWRLSRLHPDAFQETQISKLISFLQYLRIDHLILIDKILRRLFMMPIFKKRVAYLIFQLNKAVLITIENINHTPPLTNS